MSSLATSVISSFKLVSVAEQVGLNLAFSEPPKTGFLATRPNNPTVGIHPTNSSVVLTFFTNERILVYLQGNIPDKSVDQSEQDSPCQMN